MNTVRTQTILLKLLPLVAQQGWTMAALQQAGKAANEMPQALKALFPNGVTSAISAWQDMLDQQMVARVTKQGWQSDRTRDKIAQCVWTRLELIGEHHDAFRQATRQRLGRPATVTRDLWHSADKIWTLVGDTSTDYNHYTKRALLSKLLFKTILSYLGDTSLQYQETRDYLTAQIEQIIAAGQKLGTFKPTLTKIWSFAEKMGVRV